MRNPLKRLTPGLATRRETPVNAPAPGSETIPSQGLEFRDAEGAAAQTAEEEALPALKSAPDNIDVRCIWDALPGIAFEALDFGPEPCRTNRWSGFLAPHRAAGLPVPRNLRPWSIDLLPRPHMRRGSLMRTLDLIDWCLTSPHCRHEVHVWRLRARLESPLRWHLHRLRAVMRDRPPGTPRWLSGADRTVQTPIEEKGQSL